MKIFKQLTIIIGISLLGNLLSMLFHLPIPGSICGMILLLLFLLTGVVKEDDIRETADFMIANMSFFFIPACVGIMGSYTMLKGQYIQTIVLIVSSTLLVMATTALVVQLLGKYTKTKDNDSE